MRRARYPLLAVAGLSVAWLAPAALGQDALFADPLLPLGPKPTKVLSADLDGDGWLDFVSINSDHFLGASVALGKGGGSFEAQPAFPLGVLSYDGALGDVDQDGWLDLVTAGGHDFGYVHLNRGDGAGGFRGPQVVAQIYGARGVALTHVDGDALLDIVTANSFGLTCSHLRGIGGGTFTLPKTLPVNFQPTAIDSGDLDQDGDIDLVAGGTPGFFVWLRNVHGTLQVTAQTLVGQNPSTIDLADFDGDGLLEVLTSSAVTPNVAVSHFTGIDFLPTFHGVGGGFPRTCAAADANTDGLADIVASLNPAEISVLLASGAGGFQTPVKLAAGNVPGVPLVVDVDGDGDVDLAVPESPAGVRVFAGDGSGAFQPPPELPYVQTVSASTQPAAAGDVDGDGWLDVLAGGSGIELILSIGPATFAAPVALPLGASPGTVGLADFDLDGALDLFATLLPSGPEAHKVCLFHGDGAGGFGLATLYATGSFPGDAIAADLDLDGRPDVATANSSVSVFLNDGAGGLQTPIDVVLPCGAAYLAVGHANGDALPDLVASCGTNGVQLLQAIGAGAFAPVAPVGLGSLIAVWGLEFADLDEDGLGDVAVSVDDQGVTSSDVRILKGDGAGGFSLSANLTLLGDPLGSAAVADLDADGRADVAAPVGGLSVFRGASGGTFAVGELYAAGPAPRSATAADFDHDGRVDLLVRTVGLTPKGSLALHRNLLGQPPGAVPFSIGSPSCGGIQGMGAGVAPKVGESAFALTCTNAPALAKGFALLGTTGSYLGVDPFGLGLVLHVDPLGSFFGVLGTKADPAGFARKALPIPADSALGGAQLYAQTAWIEPIGPGCSASPLPLSTSSGLQITIAP